VGFFLKKNIFSTHLEYCLRFREKYLYDNPFIKIKYQVAIRKKKIQVLFWQRADNAAGALDAWLRRGMSGVACFLHRLALDGALWPLRLSPRLALWATAMGRAAGEARSLFY